MSELTCIDCRQAITRAAWPGPRDLGCYEAHDAGLAVDWNDPAERDAP